MALATSTIWQIQASATTGNVNGAGFNSNSANFLTDLTATVANTSAPVVASASYNFVAGDVGNYVYVKSGTSWQAGWYKIASVASNAATLTATIGSVITAISAQGVVTLNTVVGCTSNATATLSGGTWGLDYSQTDTATATSSTATSSGAGSVILFAGATASMIGNIVHVISGTNFTAGWYEITAATAGVSVTTDRAVTTGVGATGVINVGGAGRMNGLEDTFQSILPTASVIYVKNGSYTFSGAISTANANNTTTNPAFWLGYNATRGDTCVGTNRPLFALGANACSFGANQLFRNFNFTTSAAGGIVTSSPINNCKIVNNSATANRIAFGGNSAIDCEFVSQNGTALSNASAMYIAGCYIHDSNIGITNTASTITAVGNIIEACASGITNSTSGSNLIQNNTIYGSEAKVGTGINLSLANSPSNKIANNIIYGCVTGISIGTGNANTNFSYFNDFFNNTTDVTNYLKSATDIALNPQFAGASQLVNTGTVTTSGSVLTDSGASFGVTDNVDYLHVLSGTGVTVGCYLITSHTSTTLTVNNALGTGSSVTYYVTHGHNFQIGTNLKALGFPNFINATGGQTTSYPDNGGVQRQEPSSGAAGGSFTFVS